MKNTLLMCAAFSLFLLGCDQAPSSSVLAPDRSDSFLKTMTVDLGALPTPTLDKALTPASLNGHITALVGPDADPGTPTTITFGAKTGGISGTIGFLESKFRTTGTDVVIAINCLYVAPDGKSATISGNVTDVTRPDDAGFPIVENHLAIQTLYDDGEGAKATDRTSAQFYVFAAGAPVAEVRPDYCQNVLYDTNFDVEKGQVQVK